MTKAEIDNLVELRMKLITKYNRLKDYRQNKNAIMREMDHAELLHETIVKLDGVLKQHVSFE